MPPRRWFARLSRVDCTAPHARQSRYDGKAATEATMWNAAHPPARGEAHAACDGGAAFLQVEIAGHHGRQAVELDAEVGRRVAVDVAFELERGGVVAQLPGDAGEGDVVADE